jgi:hypothetical protein
MIHVRPPTRAAPQEPIVAFDATVPIGTWDVSVEFVAPLPAALAALWRESF